MSGAAFMSEVRSFRTGDLAKGCSARRSGASLGDRALDILTYLADAQVEVIAKQELIDHVWSDVTVEEGSLRVHVAAIRKALG